MKIVLFDQDCPLCRNLAKFAQARTGKTLRFISWEDFRHNPPDGILSQDMPNNQAEQLGFWTGDALLLGEFAWAELLRDYPDLQPLSWMTDKLGLTSKTAKTLNRIGHAVRKACWRCPDRPSLR